MTLLLVSFFVLNILTKPTTANSLIGELVHDSESSRFENKNMNYFSMAGDDNVNTAVKRAPWAPSEIRYDEFIEKVRKGKSRFYGSREKHSNQNFQRPGRSANPADLVAIDSYSNRQQIENMNKIVKDLQASVSNLKRFVEGGHLEPSVSKGGEYALHDGDADRRNMDTENNEKPVTAEDNNYESVDGDVQNVGKSVDMAYILQEANEILSSVPSGESNDESDFSELPPQRYINSLEASLEASHRRQISQDNQEAAARQELLLDDLNSLLLLQRPPLSAAERSRAAEDVWEIPANGKYRADRGGHSSHGSTATEAGWLGLLKERNDDPEQRFDRRLARNRRHVPQIRSTDTFPRAALTIRSAESLRSHVPQIRSADSIVRGTFGEAEMKEKVSKVEDQKIKRREQ